MSTCAARCHNYDTRFAGCDCLSAFSLFVCLLVCLFACFLFLCLFVFPFLCLSICFLFLCLSVGLQSQNSLAVASSACYLLKCMPFLLLLFLANGVCYESVFVSQAGFNADLIVTGEGTGGDEVEITGSGVRACVCCVCVSVYVRVCVCRGEIPGNQIGRVLNTVSARVILIIMIMMMSTFIARDSINLNADCILH